MAAFAILDSSRHLVAGADSATAAILGAALAGLAVAGSPQYVRLAGLAAPAGGLLLLARLTRVGFGADVAAEREVTPASPPWAGLA